MTSCRLIRCSQSSQSLEAGVLSPATACLWGDSVVSLSHALKQYPWPHLSADRNNLHPTACASSQTKQAPAPPPYPTPPYPTYQSVSSYSLSLKRKKKKALTVSDPWSAGAHRSAASDYIRPWEPQKSRHDCSPLSRNERYSREFLCWSSSVPTRKAIRSRLIPLNYRGIVFPLLIDFRELILSEAA